MFTLLLGFGCDITCGFRLHGTLSFILSIIDRLSFGLVFFKADLISTGLADISSLFDSIWILLAVGSETSRFWVFGSFSSIISRNKISKISLAPLAEWNESNFWVDFEATASGFEDAFFWISCFL